MTYVIIQMSTACWPLHSCFDEKRPGSQFATEAANTIKVLTSTTILAQTLHLLLFPGR